ncbi:heavy-metal-associated domain-containing protein [Alkaliphilus peptidifermentans]|uniref:HMA domain-containing protein n=1 Tax=Alkaliphilus peptidifermentans DSM 18978 TaxID=1120976 RepID=A0A1G5H2F2_9FIRM|nr:heavy-metal-associated domain-containing protein [Alkaliphilus peptidifermentans]SCY57914.1 hypothetical protein SAMN03080606_01884 [Alkaliphilus peptidifermentans DSM 18978]
MSLYEDKLDKLTAKMEEISYSSVPPKYTELIEKFQAQNTYNSITMNIMITNLDNENDHEILSTALNEIKGVKRIGDFQRQKLAVTFNQNETSLEHIVYKISKMGYRYINRF